MATDKRFVVKNGLQTENINFVFNDAVLGSANITATMLSSNTLSFSGTTGQLFSITDSMTGVIFAVNDISGVPSIEVFDDGRVYFAETFGNVTIGNSAISSSRTSTNTTTGILQVAGGVGVTGNINVGGTRNLFTGSVGVGTSAVLGANSNVLSIYGTAMVFGNIDLGNPAGGTSGIYFNDGTYQTTAFTGATTPSFGAAGTVQFAGAGNTFSGNSDSFFWDTANNRLGIGTNSPATVLTVRSAVTPAWFNTVNSAIGSNNFEIIVGNGTSTGTTVGYVNNTLVPYGYVSTGTTTRNIVVAANGRVGIGGVTAPQVLLDVGGGAVIGASWAGNSNFINPPANGLAVQGSVGIGTYTPLNALDVRGGIGVTAASNFGGALTVASLTSNGAVSGTTGTFSGALFGSALNTSGTATVNALVSNGAISGTTITGTAGTFTSIQNSGVTRSTEIVSNTWIHATQNLTVASSNASTTSATGALVVTGGVGIGGRLNVAGNSFYAGILNTGSNLIAQSINSNTNVVGINIQSTGQATLASAVINTNITTSTLNSTGAAIVSSLNSNTNVVATNIQSTGQASVASLVSNGAVSGTTGTFTGALYGASFNTAGTATVNALTSNGAISGTTITGTAGTFTSIQNSGQTRSAEIVSNTWIHATQNLTVASSNASTTSTTGALVVTGGVGIGGRLNVAGNSYYTGILNTGSNLIAQSINSNTNVVGINIQSTGQASVASLVSNGAISGTTTTVTALTTTSIQNSGTTVVQSLNSNTNVVATNVQSTGQASVASLVSNGAVSGTTGTFTGALYGANFNTAGTATVNALVSNTSVQTATVNASSTIVGAAVISNSTVQAVGTITGQAISSNTTVTAGTGLTVTSGGVNVTGASQFTGNVSISGNLNVVGTINTQNANVLVVNDPIIYLGEGNTGTNWDLGIVGNYNDGVYEHTGFVRNHVTGVWTLFDTLPTEPNVNTGNVDWANSSLTFAAFLVGNVNVAGQTESVSTTTGALRVPGQGGVGIGGRLNVGGSAWFASTLNAGGAFVAQSINSNTNVVGVNLQSTGQASVASLVSNGAVSGTAGTFTGALYGASFNTAGTATVNALVSNGAIGGTTITGTGATLTSSQNSGNERAANIVSNTWIHATQNLTVASTNTSTSTTTGAFVLSGGAGIAGAVHIGGLIYGASTLNIAGAAQVNSLISNGAISSTTITGTAGTFTSIQNSGQTRSTEIVSNTWIHATQNLTVASSNASTTTATGAAVITGGVGIGGRLNVGGASWFASTLNAGGAFVAQSINSNTNVVGVNLQSTGQATVSSLVSNGAITGTTITGTAATITSSQNSGNERAANIVSNTWIHATQNLTVASSNTSTSTTTGALVVSGGAGIAGAVHAGGLIYGASTLNIAGAAQVNSLISNGAINGTTITGTAGTFTSSQNSGLERAANIVSNTWIHATQNLTVASSNASTTTATGAAVITGGLGVGGNINAGGVAHTFNGSLGLRQAPTAWTTAEATTLLIESPNSLGATISLTATGTDDQMSLARNAYLNNADWRYSTNDVTTRYVQDSTGNHIWQYAAAGTVGSAITFVDMMTLSNNGLLAVGSFFTDSQVINTSVGIGTADFGGIVNAASIFGTVNVHGNVRLIDPTGGTAGIYFRDGTYQTTAFTGSASTPSYGPVGTIQVAGAANAFAGDGSNFFWDNTNKRLGIGTASPTNILTVRSTATPAFFNTLNSAVSSNNFEILVGNGTSTGTTLGYVNNTVVPYGYLSAGTTTRNIIIAANGRVGIGGVTAPQNLLDVGGTVVIGASFAGNSNFINAPASGLAVQGSVGIGTYTPLSSLDVRGGVGVTSASNFGGAVTVASLTSNGAITGTTGTFTSSQNSGNERAANIVSNTWIHATQNLTVASSNASTSTTTGAFVSSGGAGIAGNINVGGTRNLFTGSVGVGTSAVLGTTSNVLSVYGTAMVFGNIDLGNPAGGTSGIYFNDGTYQVSANGPAFSLRTSNYTAVNGDKLLCDTSGGTFTVTLPAGPVFGDTILIYDRANFTTNPLNIARNGATIEGVADDFILDIGQTKNEIVYDGSTWHIYVSIGPRGLPGSNASTTSSIAYSIALG